MTLVQGANNFDPSPDADSNLAVENGSAVLPEDGPAGTAADIAKTQNGAISLYTVQSGDTLSGIAAMFGVTENTILWANDLTAKSVIKPGDQLVILPVTGVQYIVKKGDTIASIAKATGGDAGDIANYNGIDDATLVVGTQILIPDGEAGTASAAPVASSGTKKPTSTPVVTVTPTKVVTSATVLQGWAASGAEIPSANNPAEPARGVGPVGTGDQISYYMSPLPASAKHTQTQNIHGYNAVDIAAPTGTPIIASADGQVIIARAGGWNGGYGSYVVINHDNGSQTLYAHMSKVAATVGEQVVQGQIIGYVGETGDATGPHVHFEIRDGIRNPF